MMESGRHLSQQEIDENEKMGKPFVIRLKVPTDGKTTFHDVLMGDITRKNKDVNPDPVLLKSDGFPTYHLANVIDDHMMNITHIMRAQEWIPSWSSSLYLSMKHLDGHHLFIVTCQWSWEKMGRNFQNVTDQPQ